MTIFLPEKAFPGLDAYSKNNNKKNMFYKIKLHNFHNIIYICFN